MPNEVEKRMGYIQKVFLGVQDYMQKNRDPHELIIFLDSEPPEFRSVAYESASMEIGLKDLLQGRQLNEWMKFCSLSKEKHSFHLEIGLGWAFAKAEIAPSPYLELLAPPMQWMVFDGIGYYYGLFKGRRTVKNHQVPETINGEQLHGFDQGLGRRLWYICKGEVNGLVQFIQSFPSPRHPDLWRGAGIACGYVGGSEKTNLELLVAHSAGFKQQLCTGVALAALSRNLSDTVTRDIELACEIICGIPLQEVLRAEAGVSEKIDFKSGHFYIHWMTQLEEKFS